VTRSAIAAVVCLCALATPSSGAGADTYGFRAPLDAGQVVPGQLVAAPAAVGTFTGTLTLDGKIEWTLRFSHLSSRAVRAHVHLGALGKSGPVVQRVCRPCRTPAEGSARVSASVIRAIQGGRAYVDVHTRKNPTGEIRGQIRVVQGG
jgi:CHRD domain